MFNLKKYSMLGFISIFLSTGCTIYTPLENSVENTDYAVSEDFSFTVYPTTQDYLILEAVNGSIETRATNTAMVRVEGVRIVESESYKDAGDHLYLLEVDIDKNADRIVVKTDQPSSSHGRNYKIDYYIELPYDWDLSIYQVNGPAVVLDLEGSLWCELVNGNLTIDDSYGNLCAAITNGNIIAASQIPYKGHCSLHIVNGILDLSIPSNSQAEVNASVTNGIINILNLPLQYLNQSQHNVQGVLGDGNAEIALSAVNGMITLRGI